MVGACPQTCSQCIYRHHRCDDPRGPGSGLQIMGRVGQGVNPFHRNRGWHATATVGAVGCAAGCARLLGLSTSETAHAISIATSMCGGFMSQFGTMTKPYRRKHN